MMYNLKCGGSHATGSHVAVRTNALHQKIPFRSCFCWCNQPPITTHNMWMRELLSLPLSMTFVTSQYTTIYPRAISAERKLAHTSLTVCQISSWGAYGFEYIYIIKLAVTLRHHRENCKIKIVAVWHLCSLWIPFPAFWFTEFIYKGVECSVNMRTGFL